MSAFPSAAAKVPAATQTVRDFIDALNYEMETGDEAPALALISTTCVECIQDITAFHDDLDNGQRIEGARLHLTSVDSAYPSYVDVVSVVITITEDGGTIVDTSGKTVRTFEPIPPTKLAFQLELDKAQPLIFQLDTLAAN